MCVSDAAFLSNYFDHLFHRVTYCVTAEVVGSSAEPFVFSLDVQPRKTNLSAARQPRNEPEVLEDSRGVGGMMTQVIQAQPLSTTLSRPQQPASTAAGNGIDNCNFLYSGVPCFLFVLGSAVSNINGRNCDCRTAKLG